MSHHLNDIAKIDASSLQIFWKCSLRNPLKAPTTTQKVIAVFSYILLVGFLFYPFKAWDVEIERGKYHLVNPKQIHRITSYNPTESALNATEPFLLKLIYKKNPNAFLEKLDKLFHELKVYHKWSNLNSDQLKKLAQLRRLYAVAKQQEDSTRSSGEEHWEKADSGRWVQKSSQAPSDVKTLSKLLQEIEENIKPLWDKFLGSDSDPILELNTERKEDLLDDHRRYLGHGNDLEQMITQQRKDLRRME